MQIRQLTLNNVKSYAHADIPFAPGTNAICGHNGAGKSTVLEAIGFALFDYLAVKQTDFVREGEKTATVTVHVADTDERIYHVVRKCGGSSQYYIYDPDLDQRLTDGKAETLTWLRDFLGIDPAADLTVLFRDAVGVPQGLLTAAFLETASRRKDIFNPLLRVDEYERVWDALREPRRVLEHHIGDMATTIAGMEAEVKAVPDLRAQLDTLTADIAQSVQRQEAAQATLDDVAERKIHLESLKAQLDDLEKHVTQAEAALQTLTARHADAQAAVDRATAAQAVVAATADAHQAYLAAETQLAALEKERAERDQAQHALQECVHAQELAQQKLARLEQTLADVAAAEADMAALAPQVAEQDRLDAALDAAKRAVAQRATATQTLAREQQRLAEMDARLTEMQSQLHTRATVEADAQQAQADLDALNTQRETLAAQLATQQAEDKALAAQAKQAARRLKDAQRDAERAEQQRADLQSKRDAIQAGLADLADLEAQIAALQASLVDLGEQERDHTAQLAAAQTELERLHTQSSVLSSTEAADCPVCGAPLSVEHRAELLAQNQTRVAELEATIAEVQAQQSAAVKARRSQERKLSALDKKIKQLPRPAELDEVTVQIAAQQSEVEARQTAVTQAQADIETLDAQQATLKTTLDDLHPQVADLEARQQAQQRAVRDSEAQLKALPRPAEAETLAAQLSAQSDVVAENETTVAALQDAPEALARVEAALAALSNPRRAYQRANDIAAQRATTEGQHTMVTARLAELASQHQALTDQVRVFADLEARLTTTRADRDDHAPDHQRYLQHEREAAMGHERQATLDAVASELLDAQTRRDAQIAARDEISNHYNKKTYTDLVAQHGALREELAGLAASLRHQQAQEAAVQESLARLDAVQRDLAAAQSEREELAAVQALLETLRQILRDAGPAVTRALVEMISLHADQLFGEIMQGTGHSAPPRLRWTEEYDIILSREGIERGFQQLSGGEQMAAALAVRLALLQEVSAVDVAFFDEPTANLDRDRRANLARQVLNIQGFGQLFVISHDDTFEQGTDFVVKVEKVNGESRVGV